MPLFEDAPVYSPTLTSIIIRDIGIKIFTRKKFNDAEDHMLKCYNDQIKEI